MKMIYPVDECGICFNKLNCKLAAKQIKFWCQDLLNFFYRFIFYFMKSFVLL